MADTVKVPQWQVEKAWENWLDFHYGLDCEQTMERFCRLIDPTDSNVQMISAWQDDDTEEIAVFPDIATRLNMLSGPYHHAYIKAYYANHPWKES